MDKNTFIEILNKGSDKLVYRDMLVDASLKNPAWIGILLNFINNINDENSTFPARILELSCRKDLTLILPFLDAFCAVLPRVTFDGVVRPCAKICELLMIAYFNKKDSVFLKSISHDHLKKITEVSFDWMITDKATAIQAYTMQTLYLLGSKFDWIHQELALTIEKKLPNGSTGYKNRGRKVLKAIATGNRLKL